VQGIRHSFLLLTARPSDLLNEHTLLAGVRMASEGNFDPTGLALGQNLASWVEASVGRFGDRRARQYCSRRSNTDACR
jgi:hypothetical protein